MSAPAVHQYTFGHIIPHLRETGEWSDFVADYTVTPDGAGVMVEDIFMLEGEERLQIGDEEFEELTADLEPLHGRMLAAAGNARGAKNDQ